MRIRLFSQETRDRTRGNSLELWQGRFRLDFGIGSSWKGLSSPGKAAQGRVEPPSLEGFNKPVDVAVRDMG